GGRRVPRRAAAVPRHPGGCGGDARGRGDGPGSRPGRLRRGGSRSACARRRSVGGSVTWLVVIGGLVLLVFLHELGHFSAAMAVGVRPRSSYIGFPPAPAQGQNKAI